MSYVSRTGRKAKSTIFETVAFGGIGGRKRTTMNARQADNLLKRRAPDIRPKPHWHRSVPVINHDIGDGNLQLSEVFDQNSDHISESPLVNILFQKKRFCVDCCKYFTNTVSGAQYPNLLGLMAFLQSMNLTIRLLCLILQDQYWLSYGIAITIGWLCREGEKFWQLERLTNLCPACFDMARGEDHTASITPDGNMQHIRFKDSSSFEFAEFSPKLFVDYGRRQFDLAVNNGRAYTSCLPDTAWVTNSKLQTDGIEQKPKLSRS
ncbi:hypothetical protein BDD12DRAFT_809997 [Trichophaea hybrida]|nr:hypothetical protein BDD12DRAFT_809997 [Trichophaea hybrida]